MIVYDDRPVKQMVWPSLFFLLVGLAIGLFLGLFTFLFPDLIKTVELQFGRLRPVHVNTVSLLWLLAVNMGLFYYIVPRLAGVPLWSYPLACVTNLLFWVVVTIGVFSLPFGTNWGWEYAELPMLLWGWFPVKVLFALTWVLFSVNLMVTVWKRHYQKIYVALWYAMGTLVWTVITFIAGSFVMDWVPAGIARVNVNFFYVHNLVGLIFTPMGLAVAYYFIPKIADTPLYSHRLSMLGFWSIALVYAWVGAHHMIHGPIAQWLQTTSIVFSVWLIIPVWTVVTNFLGTMRFRWREGVGSTPLRFFLAGTIFYLVTCLQGPLHSLRTLNMITSKTDWIIGHAHIALLGAFSFFAFGALYEVIPKLAGKPLYSERLGRWHFHLTFWGVALMFFALSIGGYIQGWLWTTWAEGQSYNLLQVRLGEMPFLQTLSLMYPWWILRALSGVLILAGNILFVYNAWKTVRQQVALEKG